MPSTGKVLIVVPRLDMPGGVANYYSVLHPYLSRSGEYFEIGSRQGETGAVATIRRLFADFRGFRSRLKRGDCSLVHLNPSLDTKSVLRDGVFLLLAKRRGLPVLVFFRGWNPTTEKAIRRRFPWLFRRVFGRADAIIVLAQEFRRTLQELGITSPIHCETTVVEDALLDAHPPRDEPEPGTANVLFLSRLDVGKGLSGALRSFAQARTRFPRLTLTVAGEGPERAAAESLVRSEGIGGVTFTGHVSGDAKQAVFRSADVFLFPSAWEGMPNAVLEAMAYGLPVVARAVGGLRDFFEDGAMGFIAGDGNPSVADRLGALAEQPELRRRMGEYNRRYAREHFAASVVAERLGKIYDQVRETD